MTVTRVLTRHSLSKDIPDSSDLELSEMAYSFSSNRLYIRHAATGEVQCIGGKDIVDAIGALNKLPIVQAALQTIQDSAVSLTGNIMSGSSDPENGQLILISVTHLGIQRQFGTAFNTALGSMSIATDGNYTFLPNNTARSLQTGQTGSVVFGLTVMDESGGRKTGTYQISITGTNQGPVVRSDGRVISAGDTAVGNVLANDFDYEGEVITVSEFTVSGIVGNHLPGDIINIEGLGSITLSANGDYEFIPTDSNVSGVLNLNYLATDGNSSSPGILSLSIAPPPPSEATMKAFYASYPPSVIQPATNPPPARPLPDRTLVIPTASYPRWDYTLRLPNQLNRPGNALDFEVGPDKPYTELNQLPMELLLPGDRIFIHARPTPYKQTLVINSSGLPDAWIEIIGVPDPVTGAMPILDGDRAICAQGQHTDIYDGAALIAIGHMTTGVYGMVEGAKPRYIHITGLEMRNAHPSKVRTKRTGVTGPWSDFGAAIYAIGFDNICIQGNKMHHCGLGIFVNSLIGERFQSRNLHICNNWIYQCSAVDSFHTHSAYTECIGTIYEHNYIQKVITGSNGDSVKERSSGVVFRYNYIETSANAISLRDPSSENSNQNGWLESQALDSFGELLINSAFVYGNTFINNGGNPQSIVAIGDGANAEYRQGNLYFYSNVVVSIADGMSGYIGIYYDPYRIPLFGLPSTRSPITVVARNNLFYSDKVTSGGKQPQFGIFYWQGLADFQSNWINDYVNTAYDTAYIATLARGPQFDGNGLGGLTESTASPGFVGAQFGDYSLLPSSPFFSLNAPVPPIAVQRGLIPVRQSVMYPFDVVPAPVMVQPPVITGSRIRGNQLTVNGYAFSPLPTGYVYQWYRNGEAITGATELTYTTIEADEGSALTVGVKPINESAPLGGPEAISMAVSIVTQTAPLNITTPSIVGSGQVTFTHTVNVGTWTNNPINYTYQVYLNGVLVTDATESTFIPAETDIGKTLSWMVTAVNAGGEISFAMSNAILLTPVTYDPDDKGRWNFSAANSTTLRSLSSKWNGVVAPYNLGFGQDDMTCQNGILRPTGAPTLWNNDRAWLENGQGEDVSVEANMVFTTADRGMSIGLRQTSGQFYSFNVGVDGIRVVRNGALVSQKLEMTIASPAVLKVVPSGNVFNVYLNGQLEHTYTDVTPLIGGFPGVVSDRGGISTLECGMDWWTDAPL